MCMVYSALIYWDWDASLITAHRCDGYRSITLMITKIPFQRDSVSVDYCNRYNVCGGVGV
jgi:hypothetical protein